MAYQLASVEYGLFHAAQPLDYVRFVSSDLTTAAGAVNPTTELQRLVKRFSEVSFFLC